MFSSQLQIAIFTYLPCLFELDVHSYTFFTWHLEGACEFEVIFMMSIKMQIKWQLKRYWIWWEVTSGLTWIIHKSFTLSHLKCEWKSKLHAREEFWRLEKFFVSLSHISQMFCFSFHFWNFGAFMWKTFSSFFGLSSCVYHKQTLETSRWFLHMYGGNDWVELDKFSSMTKFKSLHTSWKFNKIFFCSFFVNFNPRLNRSFTSPQQTSFSRQPHTIKLNWLKFHAIFGEIWNLQKRKRIIENNVNFINFHHLLLHSLLPSTKKSSENEN